jgi:diguanylate cyclase (GGDEF)-like protein
MERLFRPATSMLGRLRFVQKFLVLGLVLMVPLGVVALAYVREQNTAVSAATIEREGLRALEPLIRLSEDIATVRHMAVLSGQATAVPQADVRAVDEAQAKYGGTLETREQWQELRGQVLLAGTTSGHTSSLTAWDGVEIAAQALLTSIGDAAKLSVDPALDSSYLFATSGERLPALLDSSTRIVDQLIADARQGIASDGGVQVLSQVGVALGSIDGTSAALDGAIGTASLHTRDPWVRAVLPARLAPLDSAVGQLDLRLERAEATHNATSVPPNTAEPVAVAARALSLVSTRALDRLLSARISQDTARARSIALLAGVTALIALYLFGGFYYCVAGAIRRMVSTLSAVAAGRFGEEVVVGNHDELGYVATAINDMVGKVRDATELLAHEAKHDGLTGLPNRSFIIDQLQRSLPRASEEHSLSVLFVDLDGFKPINDSLGHGSGDDVLREISRRLVATTRPLDAVARLSGDEFLIVCVGLPDVLDVIAVAERVLDAIRPPITLSTVDGEERRVTVGASIGVAFLTDPDASAEGLIRDADVAMYRAKELGRGRIEVFDEGLRADVEARQRLREELREAIAAGEIHVHYQPIVDVESGHIHGFEALASWAHPERGLLSPGAFMPTAESSGLIVPLGAGVLREACRQLAAWHATPAMGDGLHMTVNLSTKQLTDRDIVDVVSSAIRAAGIDPQFLWLEITESALLADAHAAKEVLLALRELGVRLIVDDFGTGYSSLQHLKIFPLDAIKIDRSFVSGLGEDGGDEAIVRSVIELARALRFVVVAEGVETVEQRDRLIELGCERAQGFLFARPSPAEAFRSAAAAPPA